jgi:hypothetical protein
MIRTLFALVTLSLVTSSASADSRFRGMFRWIPDDVNLMVIADLNQIYNSPLATQEKWRTAAPLVGFPPAIQFAVLGSELDAATLRDQTEFGVAYLNVNVTMEQLAQREGGAVETIADAQAVLSPRNVYFAAIAPFTVGMMYPANRQEAAKWIRFGRGNAQPSFAPAIQSGISAVVPQTQFLLTLNLADSLRYEDVRQRLTRSKVLQGKDLDGAAKLLASVQFLRLEMTVTDAIAGTLAVQFGADVGPIAPVAKEFLQEVLAAHGAAIDDVAGWTAQSSGNTITLRGPVRQTTFRTILSWLTPPAPHNQEGQVAANNPLAGEIQQAASLRYFQSIQRSLDGLKTAPRTSYDKYAVWFETAADTIERLSPMNVDPALLKYGKLAADSLRAIAASARGEEVQVTKAADGFRFGIMNTGGYWGGRWGGGWGRRWGGGGIYLDTNLADVEQAKQQAFEKGTQTRNDIWSNLLTETDNIKRAMYEKFKVPF